MGLPAGASLRQTSSWKILGGQYFQLEVWLTSSWKIVRRTRSSRLRLPRGRFDPCSIANRAAQANVVTAPGDSPVPEIPDELFRQAKARAALEGIKLKDLMVRGLQLALESPRAAGHRASFPILTSQRRDVVTLEQVQAAL